MPKVRVTGWKHGFQKIPFNKLVREHTGVSLKEAKDLVDRILSGEEQSVEIAPEKLSDFISRAEEMGAKIEPTDQV